MAALSLDTRLWYRFRWMQGGIWELSAEIRVTRCARLEIMGLSFGRSGGARDILENRLGRLGSHLSDADR